VSSPLLEDGSVNGARGVIINVTGGPDMSLMEVNEASCVIQEAAHEDANIIFGAVVDQNLGGKIKITVIATGFDKTVRARRIRPRTSRPTRTTLRPRPCSRRVRRRRRRRPCSRPLCSDASSRRRSGVCQSCLRCRLRTVAAARCDGFAPSLTVSRRHRSS
jgi:cell division protein FtsZ